MNALERLDLLEEYAELVTQLQEGNIDALDKLDMLERVAEIIELLGGDKAEQASDNAGTRLYANSAVNPQETLEFSNRDEQSPIAQSSELSQILTDLQAGASPMRLDFAHIATLADDDRDAANEIRAYLDMHWLSEVA